jgi:hypothetical protein
VIGQPGSPLSLRARVQAAIRDYLGISDVVRSQARNRLTLIKLGVTVATISDALTRLAEQVNAVSAAQATSFTNLQNAVARLRSGELTAEQQDAVDQIERSLLTMGEGAQRADDDVEGDDAPPADAPAEQLATDASADGETVPDADAPAGR